MHAFEPEVPRRGVLGLNVAGELDHVTSWSLCNTLRSLIGMLVWTLHELEHNVINEEACHPSFALLEIVCVLCRCMFSDGRALGDATDGP